MNVVALVPARGGSKGIPRKNLADVAGKPLLGWTIEAALGSRHVTEVVVSTDSDEIAGVARQLGAQTLARPAELAADETPMLDVVLHSLGELARPDVLVLLQPTSPLRRAEHVDAAIDLLVATGADAVVSVVAVPHTFTPESLMRLDGDRLVPLEPGGSVLRQQKGTLYARNGPAILALRRERLDPASGLYGGDVRAYVMDERDSLDVDTPYDLELARLLLGA